MTDVEVEVLVAAGNEQHRPLGGFGKRDFVHTIRILPGQDRDDDVGGMNLRLDLGDDEAGLGHFLGMDQLDATLAHSFGDDPLHRLEGLGRFAAGALRRERGDEESLRQAAVSWRPSTMRFAAGWRVIYKATTRETQSGGRPMTSLTAAPAIL